MFWPKIESMTQAEFVVFRFLSENKGDEFTEHEIADEVGIRHTAIPRIISNLRDKGFSVCTDHRTGVHFVPVNSVWAFLAGGAILAIMFFMLLNGFVEIYDQWPYTRIE